MPSGFHLTVDTLPSDCLSTNRPARHYPRFRIWRSSPERQWDFNPPDLGAAQRTIWLLLTSAEHEGVAFQLPCTGFRPVRDDRPPWVMRVTFIPYTRRIYFHTFWMVIGLYQTRACLPGCGCLVCDFCSSGRDFACGFLQIPPRDGHPCRSANGSHHQGP